MNNGNKLFFVEANVMNISAKFQLRPPYGLSEDVCFTMFFANLAFRLPWHPVKFSGSDKIHVC